MINESEVLKRPPDSISECGEEVWRKVGSDFSLVRLQFKARTARAFQVLSKQWFFVLQGRPTLELNQEIIELYQGSMVTFIPGDIYQFVNKTHEDVIFMSQCNVQWSRDSQPIHYKISRTSFRLFSLV